ncbi:dystrophin-like isoform X2 [Patiria miniata]|uniref:Dystrophin n=1 Tax=Patiria miniata TaxID=46514 RepID=A0A914AWV1_PATMI|nr:dystrophin-like isoform X2 [Patiria miniata]
MDKLWEKAFTNMGIPYYINHMSERTQWDHPEFIKALRMLDEMSNIQLAEYRAAMKLRMLQKQLNLDLVDISTISSSFDQHGFRHHNDIVLDVVQLRSIIYEVFYVTYSRRHSSMVDVGSSTDLVLNWIYNLYDMGRTGCVKVLSAKICMVALCSSKLTEKYQYWYQQLTDRAGGISRRNVTAFLQDLIRITELINESATLGRNAGAAVNSCFATVIGTTVSHDRYMSWLMAEPQTIAWLPTMHRLAASENMRHEAKCNICKMLPIIGLRFRCLKCLNYDMCQDCFFVGMTTKKHKLSHPTQEYIFGTSSKEDLRAFAKTIRNKLSKKHGRGVGHKYLPIDDSDADSYSYRLAAVEDMKPAVPPSITPTPSPDSWTRPSDASPESGRSSSKGQRSSADRSKERRDLEDLIDVLELENEELIKDIEQLVRKRMAPTDDSDPNGDDDVDGNLGDDDGGNYGDGSGDNEASDAEAEMIRAKQEMLEEQNRQLEIQLRTLKQLLKQKQTATKTSQSMYVPNRSAPPPHYHAPPTNDLLDQTAPPRLPYHHAINQSQRSIGLTDNEHANVFIPATPDDAVVDRSAGAVMNNDSYRPRPPNMINQSPLDATTSDSISVHPPVKLDQSAMTPGTYQHQLTNQTMTPGLSDSTMPRPLYPHNQSAMTPGTFASRRLLPAHLTDQSTVMFPNLSASRMFPPEEAEMNEILQRLNDAYPTSPHDEPSSPELKPRPSYKPAPTFMRTRRPHGTRDNPKDMLDAVARIGDAMSTLVARVTDRPSGM